MDKPSAYVYFQRSKKENWISAQYKSVTLTAFQQTGTWKCFNGKFAEWRQV